MSNKKYTPEEVALKIMEILEIPDSKYGSTADNIRKEILRTLEKKNKRTLNELLNDKSPYSNKAKSRSTKMWKEARCKETGRYYFNEEDIPVIIADMKEYFLKRYDTKNVKNKYSQYKGITPSEIERMNFIDKLSVGQMRSILFAYCKKSKIHKTLNIEEIGSIPHDEYSDLSNREELLAEEISNRVIERLREKCPQLFDKKI